ncbi:hypothetical protein C8R44DRAFT_725930 [Mycena epipterygia]|nr:hypothetical protein C8R44DRAFT_725930 [Mycena epipterygia]
MVVLAPDAFLAATYVPWADSIRPELGANDAQGNPHVTQHGTATPAVNPLAWLDTARRCSGAALRGVEGLRMGGVVHAMICPCVSQPVRAGIWAANDCCRSSTATLMPSYPHPSSFTFIFPQTFVLSSRIIIPLHVPGIKHIPSLRRKFNPQSGIECSGHSLRHSVTGPRCEASPSPLRRSPSPLRFIHLQADSGFDTVGNLLGPAIPTTSLTVPLHKNETAIKKAVQRLSPAIFLFSLSPPRPPRSLALITGVQLYNAFPLGFNCAHCRRTPGNRTYIAPKITFGINGLATGGGAVGDPASLGVAPVMLGETSASYTAAGQREIDYAVDVVPHWINGAISQRVDVAELWQPACGAKWDGDARGEPARKAGCGAVDGEEMRILSLRFVEWFC